MDLQKEIIMLYERAYSENPGLKAFERRKKQLLWGMFLFAAAIRLILVVPQLMGGTSIIIVIFSYLVAVGIPGIFALAVYRGPWTFSLMLLLPAVNTALDLIRNGLPALFSGESYIFLYYVLLAMQGLYVLYLLALTAWLAIPEKNREFAKVLNGIFGEYSQRVKEINDTTRR